MRDWIAQASEGDLAELDRLIAASVIDSENETHAEHAPSTPHSKFTARTLGEVAAFLGVQLQTVKEWRSGPDPMPGSEGAWPLAEIVRWRFAKLQFQLREPTGSGKAARQDTQLDIRNARELLKLRHESGELISREAAKTAVRQMFHRLRGQIQPIPELLAASVPADQRADFLFDARTRVNLFLNSLANWQFDAEVTPDEKTTHQDAPESTQTPSSDP